MNNHKTHQNRWYILCVMCIVLFITAIDNTVLNLALPSISKDFEATTSQLQWVLDAYTLVFASLLITTGSIGDRYGRKRLLIGGLALFGVGSLGAALSTSIYMLIGFRALLGIAGSLIMPSTLSILTNVFEDGKERAKAIAIWSGMFTVGAGIGPIIGGILINAYNWPSVFYLNLPIVAIGIIGMLVFVPESRNIHAPVPDLAGVGLSIVGLFSLVYGMIRAGESGWTSEPVLISFGIAVVFLAGFIWWENHSANPMLPMEFFKNMSFTGANSGLTISSFAMMGSMYFFSQFFQSVQGATPLISALYMLPMTPVVLYFTMKSVKVNQKMGTKFTMSLGLFLTGLGLLLFSIFSEIQTPYWQILIILLVMGSGIGFTMSPATNSIMSSLPPGRAGIGSAMNDTTRQLGGALGVAVLGSLMNGRYRASVEALAGIKSIDAQTMEHIRSSIQSAHLMAQQIGGSQASVIIQTSSQAFVNGIKESFLIASIVMALATITTWIILPNKRAAAIEKDSSSQYVEENT